MYICVYISVYICVYLFCFYLQIKRTIRKKHVLPSYKMRYKPLFIKPEETFVNPDICFHGNKLGPGILSVKVLHCSRLQELSPDCKLFCTLSVGRYYVVYVDVSSSTKGDNLLLFIFCRGVFFSFLQKSSSL